VRVTPKSTASASTAPGQSGTAKSAPVSFLDMLSGASSDSASTIGISDSKGQGQSGKHSGSHDSDESNRSSADASQAALLSSLTSAIPPPVQVIAVTVGQSVATTNLDGATRTAAPTPSTDRPANNAGVLTSTTQIAPSPLADLATASLSSFQNVATKVDASISTTGDPMDPRVQYARNAVQQQQPQAPQAQPTAAQILHLSNGQTEQANANPMPALTPPVDLRYPKSNLTGAPTGTQPITEPAANAASASPSNLDAVTANFNSLLLPAIRGNTPGSTGPVSGVNSSLRARNPQSTISSNTPNPDGKATNTKAGQAANSSGSTHGAENNNQQNQDSPSSFAQAPVPVKTADAVPAHLIPATSISRSGDAVPAGTMTQSNDSGTHHDTESVSVGSEPLIPAASVGASGINAARVIQSMSGTEMRVGMHSNEFGEISIRTTLSQLQLQTSISVNHSELGNAIATHIPAMQAKLGSEHGIQASIEVSQTGSSLSGNSGQSSPQRNQKTFVPAAANTNDPPPVDPGYSSLRAPPGKIAESRLDIRA
jgi:hypothetical protein